MMSLCFATSRIPASRIITSTQSRMLTSQGTVAVEKLRSILEEYRQNNYTMDTPMRFKKEIMRAATTKDQSDRISLDAMKRVLTNIGAEHRLSADEWKVIFKELGNETGEIPMQRMVQII